MQSPFSVRMGASPASVTESLRAKIHEARVMPSECVCQVESLLVNGETKVVRRVFANEHSYDVGWVVDSDLECCMICAKPFNSMYFRFRHHCRACGNLVCGDCSPYKTRIPSLQTEESSSRVCLNCFGLKVQVQDPIEFQRKQEAAQFESIQRPLNLEAYRAMRRIIPPNITRTDMRKLQALRLPDPILQRIWRTKILWLICMTREDIYKVRTASRDRSNRRRSMWPISGQDSQPPDWILSRYAGLIYEVAIQCFRCERSGTPCPTGHKTQRTS